MNGYFGTRRMEIIAEKRKPRPRRAHQRAAPKLKPVPADSRNLRHIAECLRRLGMENFADVIERAATKLAATE